MRSLDVVVERLVQGEHRRQVAAIVGARDAIEIVDRWRTLVVERLGAEIVGCSYEYVSVGITLELVLADGRRCVLKACRGETEGLVEAARVSNRLARRGFPAPAVLVEPQRSAGAYVTVLEALDRGESTAYDADIRTSMAGGFARLVAMIADLDPPPAVIDRTPRSSPLWPTPHSAIFDFAGTERTAGPIDRLARLAQERVDVVESESVVAHCDWSMQNVAFRSGRLVGVFDWDSVFAVPEIVAVASAAAFHQQDWRVGPERAAHDFHPGPETALAFIDEYSRVRGRTWSGVEDDQLRAALVRALAYQARCEHALVPTEIGPAHRRLIRYAEAFGLI